MGSITASLLRLKRTARSCKFAISMRMSCSEIVWGATTLRSAKSRRTMPTRQTASPVMPESGIAPASSVPLRGNSMMKKAIYGIAFIGLVLVGVGIGALLVSVTQHQTEATQYPLKVVEIAENEIGPAVWGLNFPVHYDRFMMTEGGYGETPDGGSEPYGKLERYPAMIRLWAGYAFSKDHNEERGH